MKFIKNNALSIAFLTLFLVAIAGQTFFGIQEYNKERGELRLEKIQLGQYLSSGHFLESTFENWESEFLQMTLFVWLSIFLFQKGSSESKKFDGKDAVDRKPSSRRKNAPWAVRKGGWILSIYKHSLTLTLLIFFLVSGVIHFYGSLKDENEQMIHKGKATISSLDYLYNSRFWFESLQNWQSEFFSVFVVVILSIYLRQKGSPQSKPVDAPHFETEG